MNKPPLVSDESLVVIYHRVFAHEDHDTSVRKLWNLLVNTQTQRPDVPRHLMLDIDGHRNAEGCFDRDMFDLQTQFVIGEMSRFLTEIAMPLGGRIKRTKPQENDFPPSIDIRDAGPAPKGHPLHS
jgi:hypothetical protein